MTRLILASESPRRKELLANAGLQFQVFPVKVSEIPDKTLNAPEQILDIASRKARAAVELLQKAENQVNSPFVVLAADTEVIFEGSPLGKPATEEDAIRTLTRLSGNVHEVITAVQMIDSTSGREISHIETTQVVFRTLSLEEIKAYVATKEPMDKAGSYGIQGLGGKLVERIQGDFDNVVGLPVKALLKIFERESWDFTR